MALPVVHCYCYCTLVAVVAVVVKVVVVDYCYCTLVAVDCTLHLDTVVPLVVAAVGLVPVDMVVVVVVYIEDLHCIVQVVVVGHSLQ